MKLSSCKRVLSLLVAPVPDLSFGRVQSDSRLVKPGDLFAVVKGTDEDGSHYVPAAIKAGAAALLRDVPSSEDPAPCLIPSVFTKDVRGAMAALASLAEGEPSRHMDVFAVTGTNGKTTTAWVLAELLKAGGRTPGLQTTVAVEYAEHSAPSARTTPGACEMQSLLGEMYRAGCDSAVMEASSHALDQRRVASIHFAGAAFTNLTEDHLDYHHTMAAYFDAKKKLFGQMAEENPGAPAVCFQNAPYGQEMAAYCASLPLKVVRVGIADAACGETGLDLRAENVALTPDGCRFTLVTVDGKRGEARSYLAGRYNIANMLCAAGLALSAGVPFETICATLSTLRPRWGRLERVETPLPCTVFVDYAHTDDALRNVLATVREMTKGRITVVFGCGGDRDRAKRPLMGRACAEGADRLVVTSDNPRSENPRAIIREILPGIPAGTDVTVEPDRREAIRIALQGAGRGDVVLVAGKGHETSQIIAGLAYPFDDREVVRELAGSVTVSARAPASTLSVWRSPAAAVPGARNDIHPPAYRPTPR